MPTHIARSMPLSPQTRVAFAEYARVDKMRTKPVLDDASGRVASVSLLDDAKSTFASFIGCLGLGIVSIVYFIVLRNLWLAADRLKASFELAFSSFFDNLRPIPVCSETCWRSGKKHFTRNCGF